ncbi:DnaJ domain-containing protein [Kamptonema cortianum]|nr:DnaJ domain-containing protein [Geitlerinema splendidum]MDK3161169.1 DnaJ domain-containing protein [Kamptonema cortianum]
MVDHYEVLGLPKFADSKAVRQRYRELARKLHPDLNKNPDAQEQFIALNNSYEVLSDPERKRSFDQQLKLSEQIRMTAKKTAQEQQSSESKADKEQDSEESEKAQFFSYRDQERRLERLMNLGKYNEAASVAETILRRNPKNATAYAALGDIARIRGDFQEAASKYGYAAQFGGGNPNYQRRYEEILELVRNQKSHIARDPGEGKGFALLVGGFVMSLCILYTVISPEKPLMPTLVPISTWTLGQWSMFGLAGVTLGASLSSADLLDTLDPGSAPALARIHPSFLLMMVIIVNFWAALVIYLLVAGTQRAFNSSLTRLLGSIAFLTVLFAGARWFSSPTAALQTLIWSGNVIGMTSVLGWSIADGVRRLRP